MDTVFRFLFKLLLLAAGLVFAAALAVAMVILLGLWALRSAWARLTGRTVTPFVMRVDPRNGFGRVYRTGQGMREDMGQPAPMQPRREIADVTDVVAKERPNP